MAQYVVLGNFTEKALADLKTADEMGKGAQAAIAAMGGTVLYDATLFGQYDFIVVVELPGDEAALEIALRAAGTGMFRTQILKAFPDAVTDPILARL